MHSHLVYSVRQSCMQRFNSVSRVTDECNTRRLAKVVFASIADRELFSPPRHRIHTSRIYFEFFRFIPPPYFNAQNKPNLSIWPNPLLLLLTSARPVVACSQERDRRKLPYLLVLRALTSINRIPTSLHASPESSIVVG